MKRNVVITVLLIIGKRRLEAVLTGGLR